MEAEDQAAAIAAVREFEARKAREAQEEAASIAFIPYVILDE